MTRVTIIYLLVEHTCDDCHLSGVVTVFGAAVALVAAALIVPLGLTGVRLTAVTAVIALGSGGGARTPSFSMSHSALGMIFVGCQCYSYVEHL